MFRCFALGRQCIIIMIIFKPDYNSSIRRRLGKQAKNAREVSEIIGLEQNIHKSLGQT